MYSSVLATIKWCEYSKHEYPWYKAKSDAKMAKKRNKTESKTRKTCMSDRNKNYNTIRQRQTSNAQTYTKTETEGNPPVSPTKERVHAKSGVATIAAPQYSMIVLQQQ